MGLQEPLQAVSDRPIAVRVIPKPFRAAPPPGKSPDTPSVNFNETALHRLVIACWVLFRSGRSQGKAVEIFGHRNPGIFMSGNVLCSRKKDRRDQELQEYGSVDSGGRLADLARSARLGSGDQGEAGREDLEPGPGFIWVLRAGPHTVTGGRDPGGVGVVLGQMGDVLCEFQVKIVKLP